MNIIYKNINDIVQYANNPRKNSDAVDNVAASIQEFGFKQPIVIDKNNVIVAGHTRLKAAQKLKLTEVPCLIADDLTEAQIKAYRLIDNKTSEKSIWDIEKLNIELSDLSNISDFDLDMGQFDFEMPDIDIGLDKDKLDDIPEIDESNVISKVGDLWLLGKHRLLCGNCTKIENRERLLDGKKADLIFTDPPFDMSDHSWFDINDSAGAYLVMHSDKHIVELAQHESFRYFLCHYFSFNFALSGNLPIRAHNLIAVFGQPSFINRKDGFRTVIAEQRERDRFMPYQKKVEIIAPMIEHYCIDKGLVADWFGGSGTTLIICEDSKRTCYMMELTPLYTDMIIKRWEDLTGEKAVKL